MNANTSAEQTEGKSGGAGGIGWKVVLSFAIYVLLLPAVLFVAAGRLDWVMGWAYVGIVVVFSLVSRIIMAWKNPDLITERARHGEHQNVKRWDKALVPFVAVYTPLVIWIVAGLDVRLGWTPPLPLALQVAALGVVVLSYLVGIWAITMNRFFSAVVRIQTERGHTVITGGPYRLVRHPGYASGILCWLATPLALGTLWAFVPVAVVIILLVVRTALEDRTLQEELPGYQEYARRVRYRLVPGIW